MGAEQTREEIVLVSASLLAERGIVGTTMRAIADGCSIKSASLYFHFRSKDEIVAEVMNRSSAHIVGLYAGIRAADLAPAGTLEALIRATLTNFQVHREAARMFYENPEYVADAPLLEQVRQDGIQNDAMWTEAITSGIAAGDVRGDIHPGRLKLLIRNMMLSTCRDIDPARLPDLIDDVVGLLLRGVLGPGRS